jgi:quercetin dioxygenase-like cupin family protein
MAAWNTLPATRLITTANTPTGQAVFTSDQTIADFYPFGPQASGFARLHSRLSVPVNNASEPPASVANQIPKCPPQGLVFCVSDFPPGGSSPMHRTLTLDYGIVMEGEIVLRLENGEEKTAKRGDVVVQRGVNHQWINRGSEVCRMMCVMVAAQKVVLDDGSVLEESFTPPGKP